MSRLSLIVSAYMGAEKYLAARLKNLLEEQTEKPIVIVVCEIDSKEEEIAKKFWETNKNNLKICVTLGVPTVYEAWNIGIRAANTEFVGNANSDDIAYPNYVKEMTRALVNNPDVGIVYADSKRINDTGEELEKHFNWAEGGFKELLQGCFLGPMPCWRKSLHDDYGFFSNEEQDEEDRLEVAGDYEFWLRLFSNGVKSMKIKDSNKQLFLGAYRFRPDSREHRQRNLTTWESEHVKWKYALIYMQQQKEKGE